MIRLAVAALCVTGLMPGGTEAHAAAIALPSVMVVSTSWQGWVRDERTGEVLGGADGYRFTTSCSATVIDGDGLLATAAHCVDDSSDGLLVMALADLDALGRVRDDDLARQQLAEHAVFEGPRTGSPVSRRVQVRRGAEVVPATVVDVADDGDVAVLEVPWRGLPSVEVATGDVPVDAPVAVLGHLGDDTAPLSEDARVVARDGPFFTLDAPAMNEGGPVVDGRGRLVGVVSKQRTVSAALPTLLRGKDIELGPVDRDYRTGIDAYYAEDYDTAVEYLDAVLRAAPHNAPAREYRDAAVAAGGVAANGGLLLAFLVVCGAIAAGAGAAGIVMVTRRRRADMDTPPYGLLMEPFP